MASRLIRITFRVLYAALAKWLPETSAPGGKIACAIRRFMVRGFVDHVDATANIERGASILGRHVRVGRHSGIGLRARIACSCQMGDYVMMGPEVMIFSLNHRFRSLDMPMARQGISEDRPVVIEDDVWIGARAILLPGVRVGNGSIIGAGAVVREDVPPFSIMAGNPARVVGSRAPDGRGSET